MKRLLLILLILCLFIGIVVPLNAEEVGITIESLAAKVKSLTQQVDRLTQQLEQVSQHMDRVESRLAELEATPTLTPRLTLTPSPTSTADKVVKPGMHLVGTDIQPGLYVGDAGDVSVWDGCLWERLSSLSGEEGSRLGGRFHSGLYYVEVVDTDKAFKTTCELLPIDQVPKRAELLTTLPAGMYLLGRDIGPGIYRGQASVDDTCDWMRLADARGRVSGDRFLGYGVERTHFLIEVLPTDFALLVNCPVAIVEQ